MNIKQRILSPWSFTRWLYLAMGITIGIQAIMVAQLFGLLLGVYFTSMAVFGFGCASGNCFVPVTKQKPDQDSVVEYEEIK
jgi:hypothetical protein